MTVAAPLPPSTFDLPVKKRFTVREFEYLDDLGMLPQRVELVDGEIVEMPPVNNPHRICRGRFNLALTPAWQPPKFISSQDTHRFADGWCPQPDFALLDEEPVAGALVDPPVRLAIEISDTTLEYDLREKRPRYARAGVPELVIADLNARRLCVFRGPVADAADAEGAWREELVLGPGDRYSPLCISDLNLDPGDVLAGAGVGD